MTKLYYTLVSFVISILILATNPCLGFEESIVAAWLFDEGSGKTVKDSMGNYSESDINGKADWVAGKFGTALEFDGSGGHIQVKFEPKFQMLNESDFTFALWFKTETTTADRGTWIAGFQEMDNNGTGRTWMGLQDGSEAVYSALGNIRPLGEVPEVGRWHHLALVVQEDGANDIIQVYSDGNLITEEPLSVETCEGDYLIGIHKNMAATNSWEGALDDIAIISKALTQAEVKELIDNGLAGVLAVDMEGKLATTWGYLRQTQ